MALSSNSVQNNANASNTNGVQTGKPQFVNVKNAKSGARSPESSGKKTPDKPVNERESEKMEESNQKIEKLQKGAALAQKCQKIAEKTGKIAGFIAKIPVPVVSHVANAIGFLAGIAEDVAGRVAESKNKQVQSLEEVVKPQ